MFKALKLALLLLPFATAIPVAEADPDQRPTLCDPQNAEQWIWTNSKPPEDVTNTFGDNGWENYDANVCLSNSESCARQEGTAVTRTLTVSFKVGGDVNIAGQGKVAIDFGAQVATSKTKSEATVERCPGSKDSSKSCACGLQSKAFRQRAVGVRTPKGCYSALKLSYDVTAPIVKGGPDKPYVLWRACRSVQSDCDEMKDRPLCADGI